MWCKDTTYSCIRVAVVPAPFVEKTILFSHWIVQHHCLKKTEHKWTFTSISSFTHTHTHTPVPFCLDYCSFVIRFSIGKCEPFNFFLIQGWFGSFESLAFPYEFYGQLVNVYRKANWDFDRDYIKFKISLGSIAILIVTILLDSWRWDTFPFVL
jgi:hypothetical protein